MIIEHKITRIMGLITRLSVMHEGRFIAHGLPESVLLMRRYGWFIGATGLAALRTCRKDHRMLLSVDRINVFYGSARSLGGIPARRTWGNRIDRWPNGAGKSTMLKTIAGFLSPLSGAIKFDGEENPEGPRSGGSSGRQVRVSRQAGVHQTHCQRDIELAVYAAKVRLVDL